MNEVYVFRLSATEGARLFGEGVGRPIGDTSTIEVRLHPDEPAFQALAAAHRHRSARIGTGTFTSWWVERRYSRRELASADLIHAQVNAVFEPAGEECGTTYDETAACPHCGVGRVQTSPLRLDLRRLQRDRDVHTQTIPRGKDVARTIAGEVVVSARLASLLEPARGADLRVVEDCRTRRPVDQWRQLVVSAEPVEVDRSTRYGIDPFRADEEGKYQCPLGHTRGLNLISELAIQRDSWRGDDLVVTRQHAGNRVGLLVPEPSLLISPNLYRRFHEASVRGFRYERATLVA